MRERERDRRRGVGAEEGKRKGGGDKREPERGRHPVCDNGDYYYYQGSKKRFTRYPSADI